MQEKDKWCWEMGMRVEIPKFYVNLQLEEFLDWVCNIEKIFDFEGVSENKRVAPMATRLWGRAIAWWQ